VVIVFSNFFAFAGQSEVVFEENFNDLTDWYAFSKTDIGPLPGGWDFGRSNEFWHPDFGDANSQPSILINGNDASMVYGGIGKSFISYSESVFADAFSSDGFLTKDFTPSNQIYVEFRLKFQPGFADNADRGIVKIFRVLHFDGGNSDDRIDFFSDGKSAPIYLYEWNQNDYGVRHLHAFRCDEQLTTYFCTVPEVLNPPRRIARGDMSMNYTSDFTAANINLPDIPQIRDLENGGFLPSEGTVFHNQVFGDEWHKLGFFVKLNSAPGVQDGVLQHWFDNQLILNMTTVPWIGTGGSMDAKWNGFSIGGNDYTKFNLDPNADISLRERWYAIDNILVLDLPPNAPFPPSALTIK
jgi:hypothetical protein